MLNVDPCARVNYKRLVTDCTIGLQEAARRKPQDATWAAMKGGMDTSSGRGATRDRPKSCAGRAAVYLAALLTAQSAHAQDQEQPLEQVVVTGSRIARPDFESASPILSVPADAFEQRSDLSVDGVVSRLPQFTPDMGRTSNNPGNGGQGNVQLRGLGATSTLVLLDGRRLIPANGNGVVD